MNNIFKTLDNNIIIYNNSEISVITDNNELV